VSCGGTRADRASAPAQIRARVRAQSRTRTGTPAHTQHV
jgi:hypothetical protein